MEQTRLAQLRKLRTQFWYESLSQRLKPNSRSELIRIVEGLEASGPTGQVSPTQLKQWKGYADGARAPRQRLVQAADAAVGLDGSGHGSMADYNLVLWEVLLTQTARQSQWHQWSARLDHSVRKIAAAAPCLKNAQGVKCDVPALRPVDLMRLRERPSFDCLALLCIVVHHAHSAHDEVLAEAAGKQLVQSFWQMALAFKTEGLAAGAFSYIERWVLPHTRRGGLTLSFGDEIRTRITRLSYEASVHSGRIQRGHVEQAAAKLVSATARDTVFDARAFQYGSIHQLVDNAQVTADQIAELWFERAAIELLSLSKDAWGRVMARLWFFRLALERALSGDMATAERLMAGQDTIGPVMPMATSLRCLCPSAMAWHDQLIVTSSLIAHSDKGCTSVIRMCYRQER